MTQLYTPLQKTFAIGFPGSQNHQLVVVRQRSSAREPEGIQSLTRLVCAQLPSSERYSCRATRWRWLRPLPTNRGFSLMSHGLPLFRQIQRSRRD